MILCSVDDCNSKSVTHSIKLCGKHYARKRRYGDVNFTKLDRDNGYKEHLREYTMWSRMKKRCFREDYEHYKDYGGRGIGVCERWLSFRNFFSDMGECPKGFTLDRIDNNGNYEPGNCRWASWFTQAQNRRTPVTNKTGVMNVRYSKQEGKYKAAVTRFGKKTVLGTYDTLDEGREAVYRYKLKLGEKVCY